MLSAIFVQESLDQSQATGRGLRAAARRRPGHSELRRHRRPTACGGGTVGAGSAPAGPGMRRSCGTRPNGLRQSSLPRRTPGPSAPPVGPRAPAPAGYPPQAGRRRAQRKRRSQRKRRAQQVGTQNRPLFQRVAKLERRTDPCSRHTRRASGRACTPRGTTANAN